MKKCNVCKIIKNLSEFYKQKTGKNGFRSNCKVCEKKVGKEYRLKNKEKKSKRDKLYYKKNKSKIRKRLNKNYKIYYKKNKAKIIEQKRKYSNDRYKKDINFKLKMRLRSRLNDALKSNQKNGSAVADLGCSITDLKKYIESQFSIGMTWENWTTYGWHIDHIKPLASFDLTDKKQFLEACNYKNLQPLWAIDNLRKEKS